MSKPKVLAVVGPTASGKTSLSIKLAQTFNGEVISVDSRQVYRGLDLGSGKVTAEEMQGVPHHLLDICDPMTVYTAADFKRDATNTISEIAARGHLPIIAGGTFFYVDALLNNQSLPAVPPNEGLRKELETKTTKELFDILKHLDSNRADSIDKDNPRRLIRAIEIATALGTVPAISTSSPYQTLKLGINISKEKLHSNIHIRLLERLEAGMKEEVETLLKNGVTHERLEALGLEYRYLSRYLRGEISYDAMVDELETKIRQFAKRQLTWLKRDTSIVWVDPQNFGDIQTIVRTFLDSTHSV